MRVIATDLDRTLIPNGDTPYDGSMKIFKKILKNEKFILVYVTGRNLLQTKEVISKYMIPYPDFLIASVGSQIYRVKGKKFSEMKGWQDYLKRRSPSYNQKELNKKLIEIESLTLQEKTNQNKFKLSYYLDLKNEKESLKKINQIIRTSKSSNLIYSIDHPIKRGLVDIMAKGANKKEALGFLTRELGIKKRDVCFSGDSGNDLSILLSNYNSIVVANASKKVKNEIKKSMRKNMFIAKKRGKLNGNYVSGIIQGLEYFGFIDKDDY